MANRMKIIRGNKATGLVKIVASLLFWLISAKFILPQVGLPPDL